MMQRLPLDEISKHSELCPGGDIRIKRNRWLYESLEEAGKGRILRENKMRMLVGCLAFSEQLCQILSMSYECLGDVVLVMSWTPASEGPKASNRSVGSKMRHRASPWIFRPN